MTIDIKKMDQETLLRTKVSELVNELINDRIDTIMSNFVNRIDYLLHNADKNNSVLSRHINKCLQSKVDTSLPRLNEAVENRVIWHIDRWWEQKTEEQRLLYWHSGVKQSIDGYLRSIGVKELFSQYKSSRAKKKMGDKK